MVRTSASDKGSGSSGRGFHHGGCTLKPLKIIVLVIVAVLVFAMLVGVGVTWLVHPNDYRDQISRLVKENTGRGFRIRDDLKISLFPWVGFHAQGVVLDNAVGFGSEPFASVDDVEVRVRLGAILQKKVEVDTVVVKGLTVNLGRNAQGVGNWEDLSRQDKTSEKKEIPTPGGSAQVVESPSALLAAVVFQGIHVEEGQVHWNDARSGQVVRLEHLGLDVGQWVAGQPVKVDLHADVIRPKPAESERVTLKGMLNLDLAQGQIKATLDTVSWATGKEAEKGAGSNLGMAGTLSVDLSNMASTLNVEKGSWRQNEPGPEGVTLQANFKGRVVVDPQGRKVLWGLKQVGMEAGGGKLAGVKAHVGTEMDGQFDWVTMTVAATLSGLNMEAREGALKEGFVRIESPGRLQVDVNKQQVGLILNGMTLKGEGSAFSGGGFAGRMDLEVQSDLQKKILTTLLDKAVLEITGGAFKTGGGEFKFRANNSLALDSGRLDGRMEGLTFALHGPLVDNGKLTGKGAVDWNREQPGGAIRATLHDLTVTASDGFMGQNGHSQVTCPSKITVTPGSDTMQGTLKGCSLSTQGGGLGHLEGTFSGDWETASKEGMVRLKTFAIAMKNSGGLFPGGDSSLEGVFNVGIDLNKREITTHSQKMTLSSRGGALGKGLTQWSGPLEVQTWLDGPHVRTNLNNMTLLFAGEEGPGSGLVGTLAGLIDVDMKKGTLDLAGFELVAGGARLTGAMKATGLGDKPVWQGHWQLHEFNLADTLNKMHKDPMSARDPRAWHKVAVTLGIKGEHDRFSLETIDGILDETHLTGQARIDSFNPFHLTYDLAVDTLDVDRYRSPEGEKGNPKKGGKAAGSGVKDVKKNKEGVGLPDMNGQLRVKKLKFHDLRMTEALVKLSVAKGVLGVHPVEARLYEGTIKGDLDSDFRSEKPKTVVKLVLTGVQGGQLLADVTGVDRIIGKANASADLTMQGLDADDIKRTLSGHSRFSFADGAIKGINIGKMVRSASQALKGQAPSPGEDNGEKTDFSEFSASIKMDNGVLSNNDLALKSPLLRVNGEGQADLPKDTVNYLIKVALVDTLEGQGGKNLAELKNIVIPIRVTGQPMRPRYQVDVQGLVKDNAKEEAKRKIMEKIDKNLNGKLGEKLKEKGLDGVLQQIAPKGIDKLLDKLPF